MSSYFDGEVAIITGAASGIGRAAAGVFCREGARVVLADISEAGEDLAADLRDQGQEAIFVQTDVTLEDDIKRLVETAKSQFGSVDVAFNNAGTSGGYSTAASCEATEWQQVIDLNMRSIWLCMKYQIPEMQRSGAGAIVNTASRNAEVASPNMFTYISTKHAVMGLTRSAAIDFAAQNIRVNALLPGVTRTPMLTAAFEGAGMPDVNEWAKSTIPAARICDPEEQAEAAAWLCSKRASYITGVGLSVDGGMSASV